MNVWCFNSKWQMSNGAGLWHQNRNLLSIDKMLSRRKRKNILGNEFKGYGSIRKTYQQHLVFTEFSHASSSFVQFYLSFPHRKQFYEIIPIYRWGKCVVQNLIYVNKTQCHASSRHRLCGNIDAFNSLSVRQGLR